MTDIQTGIALSSIPNVIAVTVGILINNARLKDLRHHVDMLFDHVEQRFDQTEQEWDAAQRSSKDDPLIL